MKFVNQFDSVFYSAGVHEHARLLLKEGSAQRIFINYFGVNYNETDLVTVKLYFSFFERPAENFFNEFCPDEKYRELILSNWKPSDRYEFMHQGLTLGLKCHLINSRITINKYVHFRAENSVMGPPREIKLSGGDNHYPGICFEFHGKFTEEKKYFYIVSAGNKSKIIRDFGLESIAGAGDAGIIEYTESKIERKINLGLSKCDAVNALLIKENNRHILDLSSYFFSRYRLYFFAPGYRFHSDVKSIYYVPKMAYYGHYPLNTIDLLMRP